MNAYLPTSASELWLIAGWTMVHFLWAGTLVVAVAAVSRFGLRRAPTGFRYVAMLAWLAVLAALPVGIAGWLVRSAGPSRDEVGVVAAAALVAGDEAAETTAGAPAAEEIIELHRPEQDGESNDQLVAQQAAPGSAGGLLTANAIESPPEYPRQSRGLTDGAASSLFAATLNRLESWIAYLPWVWIVGTPVAFGLLVTGVVGSRRLRRASRLVDEGPIAEMLGRLVESLHVTRRVTVAVCERIAAPVLIGIVRPMILLPPSALTGWSPDEIEMVLLHELAHVRRWDNLVNLLQRCVESLLFFHPAVWLLSSWVRREREACCDAVVVGRTNRPHAYAEMLVALAAQMPRSVLFHPAASSAMAAGPLRARIRRILQVEDDPMLVSGKSLIVVLGSLLVAGMLAVVYVPAIGHAEEAAAENPEGTEKGAVDEKTIDQARQEKNSLNNMKRIALAILNYQAANGTLPPQAICDANGRPLLSWRVLILPYLEPYDGEAARVNEFRQDEPWDSEHNRKLIARMPAAFRNPMLMEPGKTNYLAVAGSECAFNGSPRGFGLHNISDGTSNTIDVVEANADQAVEWTKPEDWNFDRGNPLRGLGAAWPDGWHAAYVDGHIKKFARDASPDAVGISFTRNGREVKSLAESAGRRVGGEGAMMGMEGGGLPYGVAGVEGESATAVDPLVRPPTVTQPVNNPFAGPPGVTRPASNPFAASPEDSYVQQPEDFHPVADAAERRRFPSLEEQKLADLAYKRLGLELEAIGAEELKRVRALGYEGGVKVTDTNGPLQPNDILVGLHVWPTTSVRHVADVLRGEDLAELTPLKYYVVRQELASSPDHPNGILKGVVRTGRIPVQLDRTPRGRWGGGESSFYAPSTPQRTPAGAAPARGSTAPTRSVDEWPSDPVSRPSDSKPSEKAADAPPLDESIAPTPRPTSNDPGPAANERSVLTDRMPRTAPVPQELPRTDTDLLPPKLLASAAPALTPDKSILRYDGKTFESWRDTWKTELSTDKRLEAIKALAAFGRAGYGKEAVEAILDVAGEYDFMVLEGEQTPEGKLKEVVLAELAPSYRTQTLAPFWVVGLSERLEKDRKEWKWLAVMLFSRLQTDDPETLGVLRKLAASKDSQLRSLALMALIRMDRAGKQPPELDAATRKLIDSALASDDLDLIGMTLPSLVWSMQEGGGWGGGEAKVTTKLLHVPLNLPFLLFHQHEGVRLQARRLVKLLDQGDADALVTQLVSVLKDRSRAKDHIAALRALAALGEKGKNATPDLVEVLKVSDEQPKLDAALVAMIGISGQPAFNDRGEFNLDLLSQILSGRANEQELDVIGKKFTGPNADKLAERLAKEYNAVLPPENQNLGGGGFF
jgi:beta-lactamase regulating signal transducer with metallopeptidase domain